MRSQLSRKVWLHLHQNIDVQRLVDMNIGGVVVLSESARVLKHLNERIPEFRSLLRMRMPGSDNWLDHEPEDVARAAYDLAREYRPTYVTPANEQNNPRESGGKSVSMADIADFSYRFFVEWKRLGYPCQLASPALAPWYPYDYNALSGAFGLYDLIGTHTYWQFDGSGMDTAISKVDEALAAFPNKRQLISEFGKEFDRDSDFHRNEAARQIESFIRTVGARERVEAAALWVDDSNDAEFKRWSINGVAAIENILSYFGRDKSPAEPVLTGIEEPTSIVVDGFEIYYEFMAKFIARPSLYGKPIAPMAYSGSAAIQRFQNGLMVWTGDRFVWLSNGPSISLQ